MANLLVVGDLHGDIVSYNKIMSGNGRKRRKDKFDYEDFIEIIDDFRATSKNKKPLAVLENDGNEKIIYLGDYGDRGRYQAEIYANVLLDYIEEPDNVVILKGNHEDYIWNNETRSIEAFASPFDLDIAFRNAVQKGDDILKMIAEDVIPKLPYSAILEGKYWFVHGGVPVKNRLYGTDVKFDEIVNPDESLIQEMLWNDPASDSDNHPNFLRGSVIKEFGSNASSDMVKELGVKTIIRSHEPAKVLRSEHGRLVLTLGSCPNAYMINSGAYLLIDMEREALPADELIKHYGHIFC